MMSDASLGWEEVVPLMENDFEAALENSHPELGKIKRALLACGAEGALLSGSGATVFGVFKTEKTARQAEHALCRQTNHAVFAVPACAAPISCPGEVSSAQSPVG
jgi:4-diphosphocytidyl-2-C-methyl-D-erythritol kinase